MPYHIIPPILGSVEGNKFNGKEFKVIRMTIKDDEFDSCIKMSNIFDSKTWNESDYRRGFLNNKSNEEFNTEEIGALAERAICKLFGLIQDGNTKKGGFDFDYKINGVTFDAKCSKHYRGKNYIKAIHETGYKCKLKSDFYFLAYINSKLTSRKKKIVTIDIVGIIKKENVEKIEPTPSPKQSKHFNYEITYDNQDIISIERLYNRFVAVQSEESIKQQISGEDFELLKLAPMKNE